MNNNRGKFVGWMPRLDIERAATLTRISLSVLAGRRYWLLPLVPLLWLVVQGLLIFFGSGNNEIVPAAAQDRAMAVPMTALAIFLGIRIIAGEIDDRSLEIAYTVPGGSQRLWLIKLGGALVVLMISEALLALATWAFFTPFPIGALYGALQASTFYLILAMGFATLFKNEMAGAVPTIAILVLNGMISDMGDNQFRLSPFWNPYLIELSWQTGSDRNVDPSELFAHTLQNRIGILLLMASITSLAFMRANRREHMLAG